ncbi:cardiac-enriched FHL2-interacting protein-like [Conger conger]|uniref:cardiac-enriched FHL2-interacting protein-like n=1 Tax=Conger conger TaxID=82655 RepID=UPI002A59EAA0|nr:cardiac-enriched FHL2-interacting protein-like [Conger conger]
MSCLDKRHVTHGGGMQGHYKYTDGFSDTSSVGSFMDDTDREVSSLTDRAFKSLCIGDEAVYNDSEFASSPVEHYDAFSLDVHNADILKYNSQKLLSLGRKQNGGGAAGMGEPTVGATFQQSVLDMARKGLKNGAIETAWQQRISSDGGTTAESHQRGHIRAIQDFKYKNSTNDLWEKALPNIRGEQFDSAGHERSNFHPTENHVHSGDATAQTAKKDLEKVPGQSSKSKRGKSSKPRKLSNKNFFLHSEHSAFESWRDCNRILLEQNHTPDPVSTNQRPMWYDSPLYKELTAEHGLQTSTSKENELNQSKSEDAKSSPAPPPTSIPPLSTRPATPPPAVGLQRSMAVEKRSESESDASLPPWRKNRAQSRAALPWSLPSTAAPCGESEGQSKVEAASIGITNGMVASAGAATVATSITPMTSVTMAPPMTSVTIAPPITSVTIAPPITSVTIAPPITSVTMAPPITSVTMAPPITSVTMAPPITSVTMAPPITSVTMAPPNTSFTMAPPMKSVTMAPPITSVQMAPPNTSVTKVVPITSVTVVTPIPSVTVVSPVITVTAVTAVKEPASSSSTPFSISQLLTPIIPRQGTGTSEVLQSALTPSSLVDLDLSPSSFTDASAKPTNEVKSRNSYKAIASGLLFNLKDNRKRVKSTYSPTKFKITDISKQPSKPETAQPKTALAISEPPVAEANTALQPEVSNVRPASEVALESTDAQTVNHKKPADGGISDDYLTLSSPHTVKEAAACRNFNSTWENAAGTIQQAESGNGQYCGLEKSKYDRTQLWEREGVNHPSLNLYKAANITETIGPVVDVAPSSNVTNDKERGIKETHSLRDTLFTKGEEVKHNEIRTRDNYPDEADGHNDRRDVRVNKQNEKCHTERVLSVKDRVELFSVKKNDPINQFAAQKRDSVKQGTFSKLDKHYTKEDSLGNKERGNTKQRLTPEQEQEFDRREDRMNHAFSARQNQYIKNERYTIKDVDDSEQAQEEKDAIATRYNRHIFKSNTEHKNLEQGDCSTRDRHVAGDPEALKSHEGVLLQRHNEFVKNKNLASNRNGFAQQEVFQETEVHSKSRLLRNDVLPDNEEGSERVLHATRGNPHTIRGSVASTECLQPMQDIPLIKEREQITITENLQDKKVPEEVCEIGEEKTSLKNTEKEKEKNRVKTGSPAEMNKHLTACDGFAIVEKDQQEHCNEIKDAQPSENNVFENNMRAPIKREAPGRERSKSDIFGEKEKESSKVRDDRSRDKEHTKEEEGKDGDKTTTKQNELEKCTLVKEKELKGNGKSDTRTLANKEKDSKMKQILKLKDKVKDVFSMRENKTKEELSEKQDKRQAKQEATQKEEDHTRLSPCSNIETNKVKHECFEMALEESIESEKKFSSVMQDSRGAVTKDNTEEPIKEQTVTVRYKKRPAPPVPQRPPGKRDGQSSHTDMPAESAMDSHLPAEEAKSKTLEKEIKVPPALGDAEGREEESEEARNKMTPATKDQAEIPPLLYYAIPDGESEIDTRLVASPMSESALSKEASPTSPTDLDEGGWVRCLIEYAKSQTPRSNASSPSTIRHTLFKVKDNTVRTSPLTKIIKSPLHRFPEDFRLSSPRDSWSGSEKGEDERSRLRERSKIHLPRESSLSRRDTRLRETPVMSPMAQPTITPPAAQEQRSPQWSPQAGAVSPPSREQENEGGDERGRLRERGKVHSPRESSLSGRGTRLRETPVRSPMAQPTITPPAAQEQRSPQWSPQAGAVSPLSRKQENEGGDERGRLREQGKVHSPRESSLSRRGTCLREMPVRSPMAQPTITPPAAQEQRSPQAGALSTPSREQEAVGTSSGGVESSAANAVDTVEEKVTRSLRVEETEGSKAPSEKSDSVCSAGDVQPLGKPPPVLPKSEKALRRAKRLTNKRIKKAEAESKVEGKSRARSKPVRERHTEPPPPAQTLALQPTPNPPQAPQSCPEPRQYQATPNAIAQSSPLTQRKLLQDPDSGQPQFCPQPGQTQPAPNAIVQSSPLIQRKLGQDPDLGQPQFCPQPGQSQPTRNAIAQSSPLTQRKLLQDPDSGQPQFCPQPGQTQLAPNAIAQSSPLIQRKLGQDPDLGKPQFCLEPGQSHPIQNAIAQSSPLTQRKLVQGPDLAQPQFCPEPGLSQPTPNAIVQSFPLTHRKLLQDPDLGQPQICLEPGQTQPAPNTIAQSFPLTQRKLVQDPDLGQPQFCLEPGQTQPTPSAIAQSFPLTQRKLLQDPDSGQYFMVDMPVQVKTKMFFDPETGKYIQLPVQAPEVVSSRPPSMEILNSPYLLYPGFMPVPMSSLPPRGSAAQTPASEILMVDQEMLQSRSAPYRLEDCQQTQSREAETYAQHACVPFDCFPEEPLYMEDEDSMNSRIMNAVTVSGLDSFAVDNV